MIQCISNETIYEYTSMLKLLVNVLDNIDFYRPLLSETEDFESNIRVGTVNVFMKGSKYTKFRYLYPNMNKRFLQPLEFSYIIHILW